MSSISKRTSLTGAEFLCVRVSMGLTQAQLADKMNVVHETVRRWENESVPPPLWACKKLSRLGLEFDGQVDHDTKLVGDILVPRTGSVDGWPASWYQAAAYAASDISGKHIRYMDE